MAIAIVAETCSPFTVLPALMNEYRVPELNVQNGVLKSLSFLFEYIGEMGKDYIYAVTPLLEDALMDRLDNDSSQESLWRKGSSCDYFGAKLCTNVDNAIVTNSHSHTSHLMPYEG